MNFGKIKEHNKSLLILLLANVLFYVILNYLDNNVFPDLKIKMPSNENTSKWSYPDAPLHYAYMLYPLVWAYVAVFMSNFLKIKYVRTIIYLISFLTIAFIFILCTMPIFAWLGVIAALPLYFLFQFLIGYGLFLDIQDFRGKNNLKISPKIQIFSNIFGYIIVPIILFILILVIKFTVVAH